MILVDCEQGTTEWAQARLGIPTASNFDKIITAKTMKLSTQIEGYAYRLIAEQVLKTPLDDATSGFMLRGSILERKAVQFYELQRDAETTPVGFVLRDDRRVGCSPDRFVGDEGLLEIKCPAAHTHIGYLLDEEGIGYRAQVQGQLWITGRAWCDTVSYNPDMPPAIARQERDDAFIAKLAACVEQFLAYVDECKLRLVRRGYFPELEATIANLAITDGRLTLLRQSIA